MSNKVLNYTRKRPMLLAILVMATFALGLLFSGWLTPTPSIANETGGGDPPTKKENTNDCFTASASTNCSGGAVIFTNTIATPLTNCVYQAFSVLTTEIKNNGLSTITYTCTNSSGQICTNCPPPQSSEVWPEAIDKRWEASGVSINVNGVSTTGGSGLFASFIATSCGLGTVTFYETWRDGCSTNIKTTSVATNFYARCPVMTVVSATAKCSNPTGATFQYCYDCAAGWYWSESVTWTSQCLNARINTSPDPKAISGCVTDNVDIFDPSGNGATPANILALCGCTNCVDERIQTIYIGPTLQNSAVCSYTNTQTIIIAATDSTLSHGVVITDVSGNSASCGNSPFGATTRCVW